MELKLSWLYSNQLAILRVRVYSEVKLFWRVKAIFKNEYIYILIW